MSDEEVTEVKKSKYSSGIAKEMRRNDLWKETNYHSRNGQYSKWNEDLDRIWCELSSDAKKKNVFDTKDSDGESNKDKMENFDKELAEIGQFGDSVHMGFEKPSQEIIRKRGEHYKKLMEKEIFLRLLEEEVGKGTTWEDEDEDEF